MKYQIIREIKGYRTEQDARDERNPINRDFEAGWDHGAEHTALTNRFIRMIQEGR